MCFVSTATVQHALYRVHPDGTEEPVSTHPTFTEGWSAGQAAVHADRTNAYRLYAGRRCVAGFCSIRQTPRPPVSNVAALVLFGDGS